MKKVIAISFLIAIMAPLQVSMANVSTGKLQLKKETEANKRKLLEDEKDSQNDKQEALPEGLVSLVAVFGAFAAMLVGVCFIFSRLKQQGFGYNSLKALGLVLFIPTLIIVGALKDFKTETLAALLGTVAGYVLSSPKADGNKADGDK